MAATEKHLYQGSSSSVLYTDRRDFYVQPQVVKTRYAQVAPFLTAVSNWNQITGLKDPQYKLFQFTSPWVKQYFHVTTGTTSAADNAEDTLAVTVTGAVGMPSALGNYLVGQKVDVYAVDGDDKPTGAPKGTLLITTFTSTTSINVKNLGGASVVIANTDVLVLNGTSFGEGTEAANPSHNELSTRWNQCGIHKTSFQLTNTLMQAALRGESSEYDRLKQVKAQEHMIKKERDLLFSISNIGIGESGDTFGDGGRTDVDGNTVRSTYGAFKAVYNYGTSTASSDDQNIFPITEASYTYANWVDDMEKVFDESPDGVLPMFVGNGLLSYFNKIEGTSGAGVVAKSKWTVNFPKMNTERASSLGFNIKEWESPHGIIQFVRTPIMTKDPFAYKAGFAVDPTNISHMVYRAPVYQQNIKTDNAPDYQKNQYMSDEGIAITNIYNHNIMYLQ
jgi:hypothetical protein